MQEMRDLLKQYSACEMHSTGFISLLGKTETQRSLLAVIDQAGFDCLVPETWRYVVYGVATK